MNRAEGKWIETSCTSQSESVTVIHWPMYEESHGPL